MPLVNLDYRSEALTSQILGELAHALPAIVADALHVAEDKNAHLTEQEVEVRVRESGPYDVNIKDIGIHVMANLFPGRAASLEQRKDWILMRIRTFLADYDCNLSVGVWVTLHPAAYGKH